ncbi:MAG TPA: alanine--tRNA ligase [Planctomycetes bacterium]|nr:alanine--tRNA ligase [Planctomycetota bacterium]
MKTDELREMYLSFFEGKGHTRCSSDVLVPTWDPSVLFTPAGMNQFKDHFLGKVKLDFTRATTSQKCLRTGDIENVGRTAYHHTFFEMLGNFSFGDYFKSEAIAWAWEFLTDKKWLALEQGRLSISVYEDDDEAAQIWHEQIGLPSSKIRRLDEDENFWPAGAPTQGPDGVCGPCSEIFYLDDKGESVEIWNLVFTQFNRVGEAPDNLRPLPSKNIDTGMGLERTAATLQGKDTNYHIDVLLPIVEAVGEICGLPYQAESNEGRRMRRIADHIRACTFAIHENIYPGPNKEKYVVRRLLRRAILDGHQLGQRDPFLKQLVPCVVQMMKNPYPELAETVDRVAQVIEQEEKTFFATIDAGLERIERIFGEIESRQQLRVSGESAAELYQTYGVPPELVESMAIERNLMFDWDGFRSAMEQHGIESGRGQFELFKTGPIESLKRSLQATDFVGYGATESEVAIKAIIISDDDKQQLTDTWEQIDEQEILVVLDSSPFYGESGGQVGDSGLLDGGSFQFRVQDTQKDGDLLIHHGSLESGCLQAGETAMARVDVSRRDAIRRAHSATHILHYALQRALGKHAQQQGSKVDADWLRFDFTNLQPVTEAELDQIEQDVISQISAAAPVGWEVLPLAEARAAGAMMLFGEKYPDPVRMVSMGDFSKELCGGTHLQSTADVGSFEITSEEGIAAGTRRIVALTGEKAQSYRERVQETVQQAGELLASGPLELVQAAGQLTEQVRDLKKQLSAGTPSGKQSRDDPVATVPGTTSLDYAVLRNALRATARTINVSLFDVTDRVRALQNEAQQLSQQIADLAEGEEISIDSLREGAEVIADVPIVITEISIANPNRMRQLVDQLRKQFQPIVVLLAASSDDGKVLLVAGVTRDLVEQGVSAGNWVKEIAPIVGGGGGGKADLAQAGGREPAKIPEALTAARDAIVAQLASRG